MSSVQFYFNLLEKVIKEENILEPTLDVTSSSKPGDGYLGIHTFIDLIGKNKSLKLFIKTAPDDKEFRKIEHIHEYFVNEYLFYKIIYPKYFEFERTKTTHIFNSIAKCYGVTTSKNAEAVILDDLRAHDYCVVNRQLPLAQDHIELVLKEYAHFHALSFALKDQDEQLFQELSEDIFDGMDDWIERKDCQDLFCYLIDVAKSSLKLDEDKSACEEFEKFSTEVLAFLIKSTMLTDDRYAIITHGDGWCNNMMFKYDDGENSTKPTAMCFLDWQIMRKTYPVFDISYFFYSSACREDMDNLDYYLKLYYDSLALHIKILGSDPEVLYPYHIFRDHWTKYARYGLIMSTLLIKIMLTESDEVPSYLECVSKQQNMTKVFMADIKHKELHKRRLRDVILHFSKNKFLDLLNIA